MPGLLRVATALWAVVVGASLSCSTAAVAAPTDPFDQFCAAQSWPRPLPSVVGMIYDDVMSGSLSCWTNAKGIAPDGHDVENNSTKADYETIYRITSMSPTAGTPTARAANVTVQLAKVDLSTATTAFHPCDWVTAGEAAKILGVNSVSTDPVGDESGSQNPFCGYNSGKGSLVTSELMLPGGFPIDAETSFRVWSEPKYGISIANWRDVSGLPGPARCVPGTLMVVLSGSRMYHLSNTDSGSTCDVLKQFAQVAIPRLPAV